MKLRIYKLLVLLIISTSLCSQTGTNTFINSSNLKRANISFLVKDVQTGKTIAQHRADKNTVPASTTKLVTTSTALELLGPDFTFETKLQYDGSIENGTLKGNIYILGGGDPTLGSKHMGDSLFLEKWVNAIKALGIKKIDGTVCGDASIFDTEGISPKWSWEDMGNYYAAGAYGISIYDNTYKAVFKTGAIGSTPQVIRTEPEMADLNFQLYLKASDTKKDNAYFYGAPFCNERSVYGEIPANRIEFVSKGDIPNPPLYAAQVLTTALKANSISISQKASFTFTHEKSKRTNILSLNSPPLKEIIRNINEKSNNHYAEHLFRYIGLQKERTASNEGAVKVIKDFWKSKGLDINGLTMYDGCGLSPNNAISAEFFVDLLTYEANKSPYAEDFLASLPTAGVDGTIKNLLKGTRLQGKVRAKSGSISGVQCFAGYILSNNKKYAFAVLINNYSGSRSATIDSIEQLLLSVEK